MGNTEVSAEAEGYCYSPKHSTVHLNGRHDLGKGWSTNYGTSVPLDNPRGATYHVGVTYTHKL